MNPNLMSSSGVENTPEKRSFSIALEHVKICPGRPAICHHRHTDSLMGMSADGKIHHVLGPGNASESQGKIFFIYPAIPKGPAEPVVSPHIPGHHHKPRGSLIETMHDPRTPLAVDLANIRIPMEQTMHQSALPVPRGRVHHHPRGFVQYDAIRILEKHPKGNLLRNNLQIFHGRKVYGHFHRGETFHRRFDGAGRMQTHQAFSNDLGSVRPGNTHHPGHQRIQPLRLALPPKNQAFSSIGELFILQPHQGMLHIFHKFTIASGISPVIFPRKPGEPKNFRLPWNKHLSASLFRSEG